MEKSRADNNSKESGIALVTVMIITVVMLLLIGGLSHLLLKTFQTNIINRKFSSVYEAANGGVEYATGALNSYLTTTTTPGDVIVDTVASTETFANVAGCTNLTGKVVITAKTADGTYTITTNIQCHGSTAPPGTGGFLRFPPPPAGTGGGIGTQAKYYFYSIVSTATETSNSANIGKTEALYRALH